MKPTIEELKLAVAKMLPESIQTGFWTLDGIPQYAAWLDTNKFVTEREWLHVCWLAEQQLRPMEQVLYESAVCKIELEKEPGKGRLFCQLFASAEHRLEALCRVRHPEMFTEQP